jgi:uncharacterized membrane protein YeaQ/YmgE (transglycosylase-associated protein family)
MFLWLSMTPPWLHAKIAALGDLKTMSGMGVFAAAVIGILAGWIADIVLGRHNSLFIKLLIGVIGSFIGAFIASRIDLHLPGFAGELIVSSVGAILFLAVLGLFRRTA